MDRKALLWSRRALIPALAASLLMVFVAPSAMAVHDDGVFELDADAPGDPAPSAANTDTTDADDWDKIYCASAASTGDDDCDTVGDPDTPVNRVTFRNDGAPNATIFTGGGSKDVIDIPGWKHKDGSGGLPDKDNLVNGFAARYTTADHDLLYFGADRFDNSGDAQMGFWFFRTEVGALGTGRFGPGVHAEGDVPHDPDNPGDILILSDFTNGGTQPTIRIFEWVGSGGSDGPLNLIGGGEDDIRDCAAVGSGDGFCASVNDDDGADPIWTYENKDNQDTYLAGEFYEGGIDLVTLGLSGACFSSVLVETRSSASPSATLKDFVGGDFQVCGATMRTDPSQASIVLGNTIRDIAVITGTGATPAPNPSSPAPVVFAVCGPIASGICDDSDAAHTAEVFGSSKDLVHCTGAGTPDAAICNGADPAGTSRARSDAYEPLSVGRYCFAATWAGDSNYPGGASDNAVNECFTVTDTSSVSTEQDWTPNDSATVTSDGDSDLSGSVLFELFDDGTCGDDDGEVVYDETVNFTGQASPHTVGTDNTTFVVKEADSGDYSWLVTFTSSNSVASADPTCETTSITITD